MTIVAVEFPDPVHYIAARIQTPKNRTTREKPAEHLTARELFPHRARHVDVHEA